MMWNITKDFQKTFEISAPADDKVEFTYEMAIDGKRCDQYQSTLTQKPKISH